MWNTEKQHYISTLPQTTCSTSTGNAWEIYLMNVNAPHILPNLSKDPLHESLCLFSVRGRTGCFPTSSSGG